MTFTCSEPAPQSFISIGGKFKSLEALCSSLRELGMVGSCPRGFHHVSLSGEFGLFFAANLGFIEHVTTPPSGSYESSRQ